jgi:hypothetical protein
VPVNPVKRRHVTILICTRPHLFSNVFGETATISAGNTTLAPHFFKGSDVLINLPSERKASYEKSRRSTQKNG